MNLPRRRKFVLTALLLYWPFIFFLTHIPQTPGWVDLLSWTSQVGLGDKVPHFLAFLGLIFLFWFALHPYERPNWFTAAPYIAICVLAVYGMVDEWLQHYVRRTPDIMDFATDMVGVLTGLLLLTFLDFWLAAVIVGSGILFASMNLLSVDIFRVFPAMGTAFFFLAYAAVAICWVNYLTHRFALRAGMRLWFPAAALAPLALLAATHTYAAIISRSHPAPILAGLIAYALVLGTASTSSRLPHPPASA